MKLRYAKQLRPGQDSIVCLTSKGAFSWSKIGEEVEIPDEAGYEVMSKYPGVFQTVASGETAAPKKKKASKKVVSDYETKSEG